MEKDVNDKIINLFQRKKETIKNNEDDIKFFAGFEYVRFDKDSNGNPFIEQNLIEYANSCHYIVRIMKERGRGVSLYNYDVPSEKLYEFLEKYYKNELQGTIIEIEKYIHEDLE